jgi:homoserine O-succinyltransferase
MPISLPEGLPARRILAEEGIEFFTSSDAARWSTRPLRIAVLNLMPDKLAALQEMSRVLKPGGRLQLADILVDKPVNDKAKERIDLWTG